MDFNNHCKNCSETYSTTNCSDCTYFYTKYDFAPAPHEIPLEEMYEQDREWSCDENGDWY